MLLFHFLEDERERISKLQDKEQSCLDYYDAYFGVPERSSPVALERDFTEFK